MLKQIKNINLITDKKKGLVIAVISIAAAFGLASCKHTNPLSKMNSEEAGKVLARASTKCSRAQTKMMAGGQYDYQHCMNGDKVEISCDKLYSDMLVELKKNAPLKTLSLADLKDKSLFKSIEASYKQSAFVTM